MKMRHGSIYGRSVEDGAEGRWQKIEEILEREGRGEEWIRILKKCKEEERNWKEGGERKRERK